MSKILPAVLVACSAFSATAVELMTAADLGDLRAPAPTHRVAYGSGPLQFGHLRLPEGDGPHPVVIMIHGGCWLSQYDITHLGAAEQGVADAGFAVWSIEYRRVGDDGGGWPGTYLDVAAAIDHLRTLAGPHHLDLDRVVASGHSAGAALALWAASRRNIPTASDLFTAEPLPIGAVVALAPALDLEAIERRGSCGNVVDALMGGGPEERSERYRWASPMQLTPINVPQTLLLGEMDSFWSPTGQSYYHRAVAVGDTVEATVLPGAGHFEFIAPRSSAWPVVIAAIEEAIISSAPASGPD